MTRQPKQSKEAMIEDILFKRFDALRGRAKITDKRSL